MRYAAWEAQLSKRDKDGTPARAYVAASAARGNRAAILQLDGPPFPDALAYLWDWFRELRRGLGEGMDGIASLSWPALHAWAQRTKRDPEPYEADALFTLDAVTRHPEILDEQEKSASSDAAAPKVSAQSAWPAKKVATVAVEEAV